MKKLNFPTLIRKSVTNILAFSLGVSGCVVWAAPGELTEVPLYLGTGVQPNILYIVDDSWSMAQEVLKTKDADEVYDSWSYNEQSNWDPIPIQPSTTRARLQSCSGYNATAYDPNVTYIPWMNIDGTRMPDQTDLRYVKEHPMESGTDDLRYARFWRWIDDGDGVFEYGECGEHSSNPVNRIDVGTELTAEEKINYANWYTYYRRRAFVLKAALSEILYNSEERVGLAAINNDSNAAFQVADMTVPANKAQIMNKLYGVKDEISNPARYTPLKQALRNAGRYFDKAPGVYPFDDDFIGANPDSPILPEAEGGACQQNYMVLMTDGYYYGDITTTGIANEDGDNDSDYDGGLYADNESNTLADIAMYYYEKDLATTLDDKVKSNNSLDTNPAQHLVTYGVAFGVEGELPTDIDPASWNGTYSWPTNIDQNTADTLDDLLHATYNGRGEYFNASNPQELIDDLQSVQAAITSSAAGTAAAVGFNSASVSTESLLFQGWFNSDDWTGELRAYDFSSGLLTTDAEGNINQTPEWEAGEKLDARDLAANPRQIITFNGVQGIPFAPPTDYSDQVRNGTVIATELSETQIVDLLANGPHTPPTSDAAKIAENQAYLGKIIDYFLGYHQHETNKGGDDLFRPRNSRLGDIIHSSPQYVGPPNANYPNHIESSAAPYFDFVTSKASRKPVVYVGANDGMLHAFNAENNSGGGEEIFAYMPGLLFSTQTDEGISELADTTYAHRPYVDSTPTAADVYISGWKTYLVGGFNAGAKGVYVLDITDPGSMTGVGNLPTDNAANIVKKEFTHANLGYSFSRPQIAKMNDGRWAAIFGNGYNNTGTGEASLFILYLDGASPEYREISTEVGSVANGDCLDASSDCNGLSSPSLLDLTSDAIVDRVYAGDIQGNMWAFDLSDSNPTNWDVAHQVGTSPAPLFTACRDSAANCAPVDRQPITTKPSIVGHSTQRSLTTKPNLFVMFATGQYLAVGDSTTTETQSLYGVWDAGPGFNRLRQGNLTQHTIVDSSSVSGARDIQENVAGVNYTTASYTPGSGGVFGWYMNLPELGERSVVTPLIAGDFVAFTTTIPNDLACGGGGSGYLMVAEIFSGGQPDHTVFTDIDEIVAGMPITGLPGGTVIVGDQFIVSDAYGELGQFGGDFSKNRPSRRSSWTQIR